MPITISRMKSIDTILEMVPHFTFQSDEPENQIRFGEQIRAGLTNNPDSLHILQAWNDENEIVGFIVAHAPIGEDFTWVSQAWSRIGNPKSVATELFMRTLMWTIGLGRSSIRAETSRDIEAFYRRFGFVFHSATIKYEITPEVVAQMFGLGRESINGKLLRIENRGEASSSDVGHSAEPAATVS